MTQSSRPTHHPSPRPLFAPHGSTPALRRSLRSATLRLASFIGVGLCALCPSSFAQKPVYFDYPQLTAVQQPLTWKEMPRWMTIDWELRSRTEGWTSYNQVTENERIYDLTRARGAVEIRPTSFLTGYLQFQDTRALGLPVPSIATNMRDGFDLFQGYADIHYQKVHLVAGRQLLRYGSERVVGISDWANNSRTWDGFRGRWGEKNYIDLFSTSVVTMHPTSLDKHGAGLTFHGAVGTLTTIIPKTQIQPFVYIRAVRSVTSQQSIKGSELESTFGVEVNGEVLGGLKYDALGDLQRGSYSNDSIHSGAGYYKVGYKFNKLPWKPEIGDEYDYATGNPHRNPDRISTYDQQYPSNHNAFGFTDLFGFQNITEKRLNIDLAPRKDLTALIQFESLHVASKRDNVYNAAAGTLVKAPTNGFTADDIGQQLDITGAYNFRKYLLVSIGASHLFPGRVLADNGKAPPTTYAYLQLTYKFRVNHNGDGPTPGQF